MIGQTGSEAGARTVRVPRRGLPRRTHGAATAELAAVLPLMASLVLGLVWLLSLAVTHARVVDAARETARTAARSDSTAEAIARGETVAPPGATISVTHVGDNVVATVRVKVAGPSGIFSKLPGPTVSAVAVTAAEQ